MAEHASGCCLVVDGERDRKRVETFEVRRAAWAGRGRWSGSTGPRSAPAARRADFAAHLRARSQDPTRGTGRSRPVYTVRGNACRSIGPGVEGFELGDRVFAYGQAVFVAPALPTRGRGRRRDAKNVQRIEFDVTDEQACFSRLGDVALHSRQARRAPARRVGSHIRPGGRRPAHRRVCPHLRRVPHHRGRPGRQQAGAVEESAARLHTVNASRENAVEAVESITGGGAECVFHANREAHRCSPTASTRPATAARSWLRRLTMMLPSRLRLPIERPTGRSACTSNKLLLGDSAR